MGIRIDAEFKALIPALSQDEYAQLEANILSDGCRDPLVVWDGLLIDGHNRYEICTRNGISFATTHATGIHSRDDAKLWICRNQLGRRNLTDATRVKIALLMKPMIEAQAKARQLETLKQNAGRSVPLICAERGETREAVANLAGVGKDTVRRVEAVLADAVPEVQDAMLSGGISIHLASQVATLPDEQQVELIAKGEREILEAAKRIRLQKAEDRRAEIAALKAATPTTCAVGKYETIVIDPPWQMEKIERDVAPNQVAFEYPTMTEAELAEFDVPSMAADSCHMFCWTTHKHLPQALRLLEAWGFRYVLTMVWHKAGGFQPFGLPQYNCEFCLYARKGTPTFTDTKQFFACFNATRREHSRKPDEFYELIKRVTGGTRIDVFSREKRDGFAQFGNEADKFTEAEK